MAIKLRNIIIPTVFAATLLVPKMALAGPIYQRETTQQQRLFNGVQSDKLNQAEFHNLENRELSVNAQRTQDLRKDDGALTTQNYQQLDHRLNHISQTIRLDTLPPAPQVKQREENQQNRILKGVEAGQISPPEFHNLENRELSTNAQRVEDLQNHDKQLDTQDYQNLSQRLNHVSRSIDHDRHD